MLPEVNFATDQQLTTTARPEPVVIDCDLIMNGELSFADETDLLVVGSIASASISGVRNFSIGAYGSVSGIVHSISAEIAGEMRGRIDVDETAIVRRTANLCGELSAKYVQIETGANLEGCVLSGNIRPA